MQTLDHTHTHTCKHVHTREWTVRPPTSWPFKSIDIAVYLFCLGRWNNHKILAVFVGEWSMVRCLCQWKTFYLCLNGKNWCLEQKILKNEPLVAREMKPFIVLLNNEWILPGKVYISCSRTMKKKIHSTWTKNVSQKPRMDWSSQRELVHTAQVQISEPQEKLWALSQDCILSLQDRKNNLKTYASFRSFKLKSCPRSKPEPQLVKRIN